MILEIVQFKIKKDTEQEFLANVAKGVALFRRAKGCEGVDCFNQMRRPVNTAC